MAEFVQTEFPHTVTPPVNGAAFAGGGEGQFVQAVFRNVHTQDQPAAETPVEEPVRADDALIPQPLPDPRSRVNRLESTVLRTDDVDAAAITLPQLAEQTKGFTGQDLSAVIKAVRLRRLNDLETLQPTKRQDVLLAILEQRLQHPIVPGSL